MEMAETKLPSLYVNVTPHQYHALRTKAEEAERTGLYGTLIRWLCAMALANGGTFISPVQFYVGVEIAIRVIHKGGHQ